MSRPVTGFVWLRLLIAAVRDPASAVNRDEVARQASPGVSRAVQLKRLRNVIAKGLPEMPAVLRERIQVQPQSMSFSLEGCEIDAIELLSLSSETSGRQVLSKVESGRIQRVLTACQGTFLPEFETIEDMATDRHPTCTELIRELRESLTNKRVDLALLLGQSYLSANQAAQAITVLEPAVSDRRERKDLADRLVAAYRAAGREAEAKALEARFA
jgi:predicted Zn-dependent protease